MVKVQEGPMAEAKPTTPISSTPSGLIRKHPRNHTHHIHQTLHHYTYFHHHCTTHGSALQQEPGESGPAKFFFGPGFEAQSQICPAGPSTQNGSEFVVLFHVNPGVTIRFQIGDSLEILRGMVAGQNLVDPQQNVDMYSAAVYGEYHLENQYYVPGSDLCPTHVCPMQSEFGPVTVPMVSTNSSPPIAMPVQVPPGHVVQQIVDESGTLRHVILSPQHPAGLVPLTSHNPQHYAAGNGTNPAAYYQSLAPGFPPSHYHSNMGHPGPSPTHLGHSPPNQAYYKDERTQRQHIKLKKKIQNKKLDNGRSDLVLGNSMKRTSPPKDKDMNSVGTSEDGEESSIPDEEDTDQIITEILSAVQAPTVSELTSRCALLQWAAPSSPSEPDSPELDLSKLIYEVLLSDKSKEMKYKSIYKGDWLSCRIQDLKPGQDYSVCLQVHLGEVQGAATDPIRFTTPPCEPDKPQAPKLHQRQKTSLQLKWTGATDNGSHITSYVLEYDEGKGGEFVEFHRGREKQYKLHKLQPATTYRFRLAATNEIGKSEYSDVVAYSTFSNPPAKPAPPALKTATINSLQLRWPRRPSDEDFTVQMNDPKLNYRPVYNGRETFCVCPQLTNYTEYTFRMRAENDGGLSPWSDEVTYRTLPGVPARPSKPVVKGRIHASHFKLKWEPPNDTGGADLSEYLLEVNSGSGYRPVYTGIETESICDNLTPGTTYQLRVSCRGAGGQSNYSDPCTVTTDAVAPGQCDAPTPHGKCRPDSITIRWAEPDYNGGAPVLEYEVALGEELSPIYKGKETECIATGLSPGCEYVFAVRAVNRIGPGLWSDPVRITSGAAPPEVPPDLTAISRSPIHVLVQWGEAAPNGAPITDYRLEMSQKSDQDGFTLVHQGQDLNHDLKGLTPFTTFYFRVQACNSAGCSAFSAVTATVTPAAPPSVVGTVRAECTPTSIRLFWSEPADNGAPISHYNVECGDRVFVSEGSRTSLLIEDLPPETSYKFKVQAVNGIGAGALSSTLRAMTHRLPPAAPLLECIGVGHNYLKLKWGDGKNVDYTQYLVELENPHTFEFQCVYKGTALTYKVNKLHEITTYRYRICAANDAGVGDFSDVYEFTTCTAPPAAIKQPKVVELEHRSCTIEWMPSRNTFTDTVLYQVQISRTKEQAFKEVYKGVETRCVFEDLEPGLEYCARVCPVRISPSGELPGPASPLVSFSTVTVEPSIVAKLSANPVATSHRNRSGSMFQLGRLKAFSNNKPVFYALLIMIVGIILSICIMSYL